MYWVEYPNPVPGQPSAYENAEKGSISKTESECNIVPLPQSQPPTQPPTQPPARKTCAPGELWNDYGYCFKPIDVSIPAGCSKNAEGSYTCTSSNVKTIAPLPPGLSYGKSFTIGG